MLRFRALFEYIESGVKKMGFSYSKNMTKFGSILLENYFKHYKPLIWSSTPALRFYKNFFSVKLPDIFCTYNYGPEALKFQIGALQSERWPFKDFDLRFLYINNQLAVSLKSDRCRQKAVNPIALISVQTPHSVMNKY